MKVILTQTVPKLGKESQVVTVAGGYARNYLFPRGLAILADKKQIQALEKRHEKLASKLAEGKAAAEALKEKLDGLEIRIEGKVAKDSNKLFGAITAQDIADSIKKSASIDLEKKQVGILEPIKRLGHFRIEIDLHRDVDATVHLHVFDPEAPELEEPKPEAPEAAEEGEAVTA